MSFSPTNIANIDLWIDAGDASTFSYDSSGNVSQWRDKSGTNNHMNYTSGGTTKAQRITDASLNSNSVVRFTGQTYQSSNLTSYNWNQMTIFIIYK